MNGSVRPSVCHTFLTMFPSSYHHEIFRSYCQRQKWLPYDDETMQSLVLVRRGALLFLAATKQLYEWYFLSVCPSVRLSVRLSHLFDYVPIIVSSWNFQELSHWTRVRSMQKVKVRGQRSRSQRSRPKFSFPDCNSSLNSHMMMKWYI